MKSITPELIESLTPIFMAAIGGIIGVTVLVTGSTDAKWSSGMGLAGTAIAGAAGLARSSKSESTILDQNPKGCIPLRHK
jgi:hypothetical protein